MRDLRVRLRRFPRTVIAFAGLVLVGAVAGLVIERAYYERYPVWGGVWLVFWLFVAAMLVLRGKPWAWWLSVPWALAGLAIDILAKRTYPLAIASELLYLALLLSPSMRRWVGAPVGGEQLRTRLRRWSHSAWIISFTVSAPLAPLAELGSTHLPRTAGGRVWAGVFLWLFFALLARLVIFLAVRVRGNLNGRAWALAFLFSAPFGLVAGFLTTHSGHPAASVGAGIFFWALFGVLARLAIFVIERARRFF